MSNLPPNGRGALPPIHSLSLQNFSFDVPRSYNHSSDESDHNSRSGGHSSSQLGPPLGVAHRPQPYSPDSYFDSPYMPRSDQFSGLPPGERRYLNRPQADQDYVQESLYRNQSPAEAPQFGVYTHGPSSTTPSHQQPVFKPGPYSYGDNQYRAGLEHTPSIHGRAAHYRNATTPFPPSADSPQHRFSSPESDQGNPSVHCPSLNVPNYQHRQHSSSSSQSSHGSQSSPTHSPIQLGPPIQFPDAGEYLRRTLNIHPSRTVSLQALDDPRPGERPTQPYPTLIKLAIYGSPSKQLTLKQLYEVLEDRFVYFRDLSRRGDKAWKNSIRHQLSLNKVFRNVSRPITEPGKGSYWQLDISEGEGYKRPRKRRPKNALADRSAEDDDDDRVSDEESEYSGSSPAPDESNVDPILRRGHEVGGSRLRGNQKRPASSSPYPTSLPLPGFELSTEPGQGAPVRSHTGQVSPMGMPLESSIYGRGPAGYQMTHMGPQVRFGQPSLGPPPSRHPTFGQQGFQQVSQFPHSSVDHASEGMNSSLSNLPRAFHSSPSEVVSFAPNCGRSVQRATMVQGGNFSIPQPTPRPGVEYINEPGRLPSARRISIPPTHVNPAHLTGDIQLLQHHAGSPRGSVSSQSSGSGRDSQGQRSSHSAGRQDFRKERS